MSGETELLLTVPRFDPARLEDIRKACETIWPFDHWQIAGTALTARGVGTMRHGEDEEWLAARLEVAVWKTNKAYVAIRCEALPLK